MNESELRSMHLDGPAQVRPRLTLRAWCVTKPVVIRQSDDSMILCKPGWWLVEGVGALGAVMAWPPEEFETAYELVEDERES